MTTLLYISLELNNKEEPEYFTPVPQTFQSYRPFACAKGFTPGTGVVWSDRRKTYNFNRFNDMSLETVSLRDPQDENPICLKNRQRRLFRQIQTGVYYSCS